MKYRKLKYNVERLRCPEHNESPKVIIIGDKISAENLCCKKQQKRISKAIQEEVGKAAQEEFGDMLKKAFR